MKEAGVLLPEKQWGKEELRSRTSKPVLLATGLLAVSGCLLMYWGQGGWLTWTGVGGYFLGLSGCTLIFCGRSPGKVEMESDETESDGERTDAA